MGGISEVHGTHTPDSGSYFLDNNREEDDQQYHHRIRYAMMNGYVSIPLSVTKPVLRFRKKQDLTSSNDWVRIQVQRSGSNDWSDRKYYYQDHNSSEYATEEISLESYAGESVRIAFEQYTYYPGRRMFVVDDLEIIDANP